MSGLAELGKLWHTIQAWLLPVLEDELGQLDHQHREFVAVCEIGAPREHLAAYRWVGNGCPPKDRLAASRNPRRGRPQSRPNPHDCNTNSNAPGTRTLPTCRGPATGARRKTARARSRPGAANPNGPPRPETRPYTVIGWPSPA